MTQIKDIHKLQVEVDVLKNKPDVDLSSYDTRDEVDAKILANKPDLGDYYDKLTIHKIAENLKFPQYWGKLDVYHKESKIEDLGDNTHSNWKSPSVYYNGKVYYQTSAYSDKTGPIGVFDVVTKTKSTLPIYSAAIGPGMCIADNKLVIAGGEQGDYNLSCIASAGYYNFETREWVKLPALPSPRYNIGLTAIGDRLFMAGGNYYSTSSGGSSVSGLYTLVIGESTWTKIENVNVSGATTLFTHGDMLYIYGGPFIKFNINTGAISELPGCPISNEYTARTVYGNKLVCMSSTTDADGNSKVAIFDLDTEQWDSDTTRINQEISYNTRLSSDNNKIFILNNNRVFSYVPVGNVLNKRVEVAQTSGSTEDLSRYSGISNQLVINTDTRTIHVMDGKTNGGTPLATKEDLDQVFQSVSSGKTSLETKITDRGGTVSKVGQVATFAELEAGLETLNSEDIVGKQKILDVILAKLPHLEGVLTINNTLSDYAKYMMGIGPVGFIFRDKIEPIVLQGTISTVKKMNKALVLPTEVDYKNADKPTTDNNILITNDDISYKNKSIKKIVAVNGDGE